MKITLSPRLDHSGLSISKHGDVLTINGSEYDFSVIPDGATLPASAVDCPFLTGGIERIDGDLHLTLRLPHGGNPSPAVAFPQPIIDPPDGVLELPQ